MYRDIYWCCRFIGDRQSMAVRLQWSSKRGPQPTPRAICILGKVTVHFTAKHQLQILITYFGSRTDGKLVVWPVQSHIYTFYQSSGVGEMSLTKSDGRESFCTISVIEKSES